MAIGRKTGGRKKGTPNKSTEIAREAIGKLVEENVVKFSGWIDEIYNEKGAESAMNAVTGLIEYHVPKLTRSELKHEGEVTISSLLAGLDEQAGTGDLKED